MKNNIFGIDMPLFKKIIFKRLLCYVLSLLLLVALNLLFLSLRHEIGKLLSLVINVLLDIVVLTLATLFFDMKISKELILLKLYKQKISTFKGEIKEVISPAITFNKLSCYVVVINGKKYFSPIQSKVNFVMDKPAVISTAKNIILEVSYE